VRNLPSATATVWYADIVQKERFGSLTRLKPSLREGLWCLGGVLASLLVVLVIRWVHNSRTPLPYQKDGITASWIPDTVKHWTPQINEMSQKYDIDANVVAIVMTMESGGNASAKSPDGAIGLMQITPPTAKDIASKYLKKPVSTYKLEDPTTNIEFGVAYLAFLRKEFGLPNQGPTWDSTVEYIAASYNGGPGAGGNLYNGKGLTDTETVVYSRDAFNMWRERKINQSPTFDRWKERGGTTLLDAAKASQQ